MKIKSQNGTFKILRSTSIYNKQNFEVIKSDTEFLMPHNSEKNIYSF